MGYPRARRGAIEGATTGLATDVVEARSLLQAESDELDILKVALSIVYDDLQVVQAEGTSSLAAYVIDIMARVRQLEKEALHTRITQTFAVARLHYDDNIDFGAMSLGFVPSYENSKLDAIEATVTPFAETLASRIEDLVLPARGS